MGPRNAVTPAEIGERLGLSSQTVRLDIHAKELRAFRTRGGHFRVEREEADRYVERMTSSGIGMDPSESE